MSGFEGFLEITVALEKLRRTPCCDGIDLLLLIAGPGPCYPVLAELEAALPVANMDVPVIIGMPRGRLGSPASRGGLCWLRQSGARHPDP
jgi:hypothetical protein